MPEEIERLRRELKAAQETIHAKEQRVEDLTKTVEDLRGKLETLQRERPALRPETLMSAFTTALRKMEASMAVSEGRVDYAISTFDADLKVSMTLDEEGAIAFQLPQVEDVIPLENLSRLRFSLAPSPRPSKPPAETVEIPNLVGMQEGAARKAIEAATLAVGEVEERPSVTAPGTVIGQRPGAYARTEAGAPVDLVISGPRETEVPEVIGLGRDDAEDVLESSGLAVGEVTERVSDSPPGTVIGQGIPGGTVVPIETAVDLTVAKAKMTEVPDVTGASVGEAKRRLKRARLRAGDVAEETSDEPAGTVIGQRPDGGKEVPINSRVRLVMAKPRMIAVPELRGLEREAALGAVDRSGLTVGEVVHEASDEPPGTVIRQKPEAGSEVQPGARVALTVSRAETVIVPDLKGLRLKEAERVAAQHDLTVERVIRRRSKEPEDTVIGQRPDGGAEVPAGTALQLTVSIE